jgi:predicted DNA-binding transcriptional regulator AlpA
MRLKDSQGQPERVAPYARISECEELFSMSRATVYRRAKEGCFHLHKLSGGMTRLNKAEVYAWIESQKTLGGGA